MRIRILTVAALIAATAGTARAQFFNAVYSKDGRDVIAVGDSGQVFRSLNGGDVWFRSDVGARPLRDVAHRGFTIVTVGDSGKIWRSPDNGGTWALTVLTGAPNLHALAWPSSETLFVAGAGGTIHRSVNGGQSWSALSSGTSQRLRAIRFRDPLTGWAVGDAGTVLTTGNGGQTWNPVTVPTTRGLEDVDYIGPLVWAVGEHGVALKSTDSGANWTPQNLKLDSGSAVRVVWIQSADTVYVAGGGGFVRRSDDGGATWTFLQHTLQGELTGLYFAGGGGWMVNRTTRLIPRTTNTGTTWTNPAGTVQRRTWPKLFDATGTIRGSTLTLNPLDQKTLYMMMGPTLYRSRDDAATWSVAGTVPSASKANAFAISHKDTNIMLAAVGTPDRVVRSTNGGATWATVITASFGEYGVPLEQHPDDPDTVYFGPDGAQMQMSTDFGLTWNPLGTFSFISPCDIVAIPENDSGVIVVGDGITSSGVARIHRSNDGGATFKPTFAPMSGASEVPTMSSSRLRNTAVFASAWSSGSFKRSQDTGLSWPTVIAVGQSWGNDIARDDPNVVVMGSYGFTVGYLSMDGGSSWATIQNLPGSNYSIYIRDRGFILAEQGTGLYRLAVSDSFQLAMSQTLALSVPDGGEDWNGGSVHLITWNAAQVAQARIEYRKTAGDPWQLVALVDGAQGSYAWTCPNDATSDARIRVSDAWDASPQDQSSAPFRIRASYLVTNRTEWDFGGIALGLRGHYPLQISNPGDGPLELTSITSPDPRFWPGRASLTLGAGASDTLGVWYEPDAAGPHAADLTLASSVVSEVVSLAGHGVGPVAVDDEASPLAFALEPARPNPFTGRTLIRYSLPQRERVTLDVYDVQGHRVARLVNGEQAPGRFTIPFGNDASARTLPAGVYFVRLEAGMFRASRKILMLR